MKKILILAIALIGCQIEEPVEPAPGPAGKDGINGKDGKDGNAEVIQISFGPRVHYGQEITYTLNGVSSETLAKSAVFIYVNPGNEYWYFLPGPTAGGYKEYRTFIQYGGEKTPMLFINRVSGSGQETFTALKVIIVPANILKNGRLENN